MKVLLDYFIFDGTTAGGIYRYFYHLIEQSKKMPELEYILGCLFGESVDGKNELGLIPKTFPRSTHTGLNQTTRELTRAVNILYSLSKMSFSKYDILHPTYATLYFPMVTNRIKTPLAFTVYDMIPELFPEYRTKSKTQSRKKRYLCEKADILFAISEQTKTDLINTFGIAPEKVKVTYLAGGFMTNVVQEDLKSRLPSKYILFIGWRKGYKNFERFFRAILPLLQNDLELNLVCTGPGFNEHEKHLFQSHFMESRVWHHFANDDEFYTLYHGAEAFIFPSLYEGFGIPVLEAFSCECPAIVSHSSSLIEVGGEAVEYFDPHSEESIRNSVQRVIYNPDLKTTLKQKGIERLKLFNWQKTAQATYEGYCSIL